MSFDGFLSRDKLIARIGKKTKGERIYQDYFGDFFLRVILRFIFHLETILKTIYSENSCQIENSPQNSLQTENEP